MKKLLLVASLLLSTVPNTDASIYADVDKRTVIGINDGIEKVYVTKTGITYHFLIQKRALLQGQKD